MKIALVGTRGIPANYGGTETYVERLARYLAQQGDEVVVYCEKSPNPQFKHNADASFSENISRIEMPSIRTKHLDNFVRSLLSTLHACLDPTIDLVQLNNAGPAFFAFLPRLFGKKTVGAIRAIDSKRDKWNWLAKSFLRFCDRLIVNIPHVTTVNGKFMQQYYLEKYGKPTVYIPNGVAIPTDVAPPTCIQKLGITPHKYILFAARLEPEKGCHTLIDAYTRVLSTIDTDLDLVIAGHPGHSTGYYKGLLTHQTERIKFLGQQSGHILDELYANAFAFVLPSSVEGMSNSLLCAMSYGIPVVVSNIPENTAVLNHPARLQGDENPGLVFELENPVDLANKLITLISSPEQTLLRGNLLKQLVYDHFSLNEMCFRTRELYQKVLSSS